MLVSVCGVCPNTVLALCCSLPPAHGNSLKTCADDLIKFGTTVSTAEPLLGKVIISSRRAI